MPKKTPPKKSAAKKPAAKSSSKKPMAAVKKVAPAAKAKPVAKKNVKVQVPVKGTKATVKSIAKVEVKKPVVTGKVPAGKNAKSTAKVDNKAQHDKQVATLNNHRDAKNLKKEDVIIAPVRPKLQFFTIENVHEFLKAHKKGGSKLNLWVPDEERKAREKAASSSRDKVVKVQNVESASISDLLGGSNPFRKGSSSADEAKEIPEKLRRYYQLLISMREAIQKGLAFHSEEALKKNGKDDAGDLSGYSQHLADAGSDTADRDFALSLISNEQEALKEISDAIARMKKNTYGVCEITNKPIPHARLMAVPFTRYSLEGQKELERNRRASRRRGGNPLGEIGDEVGFGSGGGGGEEDTPET
jgi:RNA polymerase-binding transcription factor DksA